MKGENPSMNVQSRICLCERIKGLGFVLYGDEGVGE